MTITFTPATRAATKARIALDGPSGSGKTYTALSLAFGLGSRVAVIDTERRSSEKYVGLNGWKFHIHAPTSFSPASLTETLAVAGSEGFDVAIVDGLTPYWSGIDGMLEQVDRKAKGRGGFDGWKEARPDERRMLDALVGYPGHLIVTMRVKTEYVVEENSRGKAAPRKIGMRPDQREGIEYEFDVTGSLDLDNTLTITKTRLPMLHGQIIDKPGRELATTIRDWLAEGEQVTGPIELRDQAVEAATMDEIRALLATVNARGLAGAPVVDQAGNPTVLYDLIVARGYALMDNKTAETALAAETTR